MTAAAQIAAGGRTIADFEQWFDGAAVGARFVYAWGATAQRTLPVWAHAADLQRDGSVRLHHVRSAANGWDYVAVRSVPPITAGKPVAVPSDDTDPAQAVLRALSRAANFDRVCPTNAELAAQCGLSDAAAAGYRMRQLRELKAIVVMDRGPNRPRVVRIVSTGKTTAEAAA